jgi:hypothetical protein
MAEAASLLFRSSGEAHHLSPVARHIRILAAQRRTSPAKCVTRDARNMIRITPAVGELGVSPAETSPQRGGEHQQGLPQNLIPNDFSQGEGVPISPVLLAPSRPPGADGGLRHEQDVVMTLGDLQGGYFLNGPPGDEGSTLDVVRLLEEVHTQSHSSSCSCVVLF